MANTTSLKCILCGRFVPISDFPDHISSVHTVTTNPDLVVVVSSQSEDQLAELRELLASFIAELGGGGRRKFFFRSLLTVNEHVIVVR